MDRNGEWRAGQRVRISPKSDSDFAGHYGVIMHVGKNVCDVRIRYKPHGSKVRSTYIGVFPIQELESLKRPVDLALFHPEAQTSLRRQVHVWIALIAMAMAFLLLMSHIA